MKKQRNGTPANRMPSYTEMCKFALADKEVEIAFEKNKVEKARKEFMIETQNSIAATENTDNFEWRTSKLKKSSSTGMIERTINNAVEILENDTELKDKIVYDRFSNRFLIKEKMPWRKNRRGNAKTLE